MKMAVAGKDSSSVAEQMVEVAVKGDALGVGGHLTSLSVVVGACFELVLHLSVVSDSAVLGTSEEWNVVV